MQEYTITLVRAREIAENTMQYDFAKPRDFTFNAGQFAIIDFADPTQTDDQPSFRSLSIASAPYEDMLSFIMRNSESAFKQNMLVLTPGDTVIMKAPLGHMEPPENREVPVMFIAAGVGITPARAMIRQAVHEGLPNPMTLLYGNRTVVSTACKEEFLDGVEGSCICVNVMSEADDSWDGLRGFIDAEMISANTPDIMQTQFYIVGTTGFVNAMKEILENLGVIKEQLHIDNFG